jgi:hypothetical protein
VAISGPSAQVTDGAFAATEKQDAVLGRMIEALGRYDTALRPLRA